MLSVFSFAFNAVAPILLLVLLGYAIRQTGLFTPEFLRIANRFNFHYCLSTMLFLNLYNLEGLHSIDWSLGLFALAALAVLTAAGFVLANLATDRRERKGVLIQAAVRSNFAIIGLPMAGALAPGAIALASAMQAPTVIYFNLMAVVVLSLYAEGDRGMDLSKAVSGIVHNPLIRGLLLGTAVLFLRGFVPRTADGALVFSLSGSMPWLFSALNSVASMATPMALVILGGQFQFGAMRSVGRELTLGVLARLLLAPAIGFGMAFAAEAMGLIDLTPAAVGVLVAMFGSPTAVSSVVMASEMGADDVLAGQLVVWTTIGSTVTLFCIIAALRAAGLL